MNTVKSTMPNEIEGTIKFWKGISFPLFFSSNTSKMAYVRPTHIITSVTGVIISMLLSKLLLRSWRCNTVEAT